MNDQNAINPLTYKLDGEAIESELDHFDIDDYLLAQLDSAYKAEEQIRIDFQALKKVRTLRKNG